MDVTTAARYQASIIIRPHESVASLYLQIERITGEARDHIGPAAWPIIISQVEEFLSSPRAQRVIVVFTPGHDTPSPGEAERLIFQRIIGPDQALALPEPLTPALSVSAPRGVLGADSGWMQTASSRAFYPLSPVVEEIDLFDIASGLSRMCRYGGQIGRLEFYSVAEHSVLLSYAVPRELARWALLHDASEAFICDIPRPIKAALGPAYAQAEERLMEAVAVRFGLPWPMPDELKEFDNRILQNERQVLWSGPPPMPWASDAAGPPLTGITISGWLPYQARSRFLARADELRIKAVTL